MKYIIIYIYVALNVFLLILNWNLFTSMLNLDFGFGVFNTAPLILIQGMGLLLLILNAVLARVKDLKGEVKISELQKSILKLEKDAEISSLKTKSNAIEPVG